MEILTLIPARGGSERLPAKNIKLLSGKPLIAYTIQVAKKSKHINRIIVSTDDFDICRIAREYGAEVPFMRPREIAGPQSTEMEFLEHALNWLKEDENYVPDFIVLLYPTAPLRTTTSIDKAIECMIRHPEANSLRSVCSCHEHPYKMWVIQGEYLVPFVPLEDSSMHTWSYQRLPQVYIQNASIYITRPQTIRNKHSPIGDVVLPFIMDERESMDINTPYDFALVEKILAEEKNT